MEKQKIEVPSDLSAAEIRDTYNVSHATAWRASKRGWLYKNYHGDQTGNVVKTGIEQKFKRLVQHPVINIAQLTCIKEQKIRDILAGKSSLREREWISFKAELADIKNAMRKFINANASNLKVKIGRAHV